WRASRATLCALRPRGTAGQRGRACARRYIVQSHKRSVGKIRLDRQLPVRAQVQIQGQIEFGMVNGDFPHVCKLPSVRELAADLGVSPVTVNEACRNLAARGFIETIRGRGTFVRAAPTPARDEWPLPALEAVVARLVRRADRAGIDRGVLLEAVSRHASARNHGGP